MAPAGFTDKRFLEGMIRAAEDVFPDAIFAVHLDHGTEEVCYECIDSGFYSSVMIDASHEKFDENIAITRRVVDRAHEKGLSVEAELGMLGGVEEDISVSADHACLTDPEQAVEFVERSGCDSLAVAIGTSHGAYKFTGSQGLHFDRIEAIQKKLPAYPLVMHGSSSVPKEWVDRINKAGGQLKHRQRRARKPVPAGREAGGHQGEHRHRRPAGLVRRLSRGLPRQAGRLRSPHARASRSWRRMPSTSPTRTSSSARPANWNRSARRLRSTSRMGFSPSMFAVGVGCAERSESHHLPKPPETIAARQP